MSEDFDIREEELEFVAQTYCERRLSLLYSYILRHTSLQGVTHLAQVDLHSIRTVVRRKLVIWIYKVLNMYIFLI